MGAAVTSAVAYTAKGLVMVALFLRSAGLTLGELVGVKPRGRRGMASALLAAGTAPVARSSSDR